MVSAGASRTGTTYELIVDGSLGPVLRAALTCCRVDTVEPRTVIVVHDDLGRDLVDVVGVLESAGVPVLDVLRLTRAGGAFESGASSSGDDATRAAGAVTSGAWPHECPSAPRPDARRPIEEEAR